MEWYWWGTKTVRETLSVPLFSPLIPYGLAWVITPASLWGEGGWRPPGAKCVTTVYRHVYIVILHQMDSEPWNNHTYLLTHSMVQSPSWEANWFAASQEIPPISRNPKVHYRTHKRPPPVSILGQPSPVHIPISHLLEIHPNIIHPSTPRSPQWSPSLRFPHQDHIHPPLLTHTRHMPSPSHCSRFYHPHNIGWGVQII